MAVPPNGFTIEPADSPSSKITVAPTLLDGDSTKLMLYVRQDLSAFGLDDEVAVVWLTNNEAIDLIIKITAVLNNA